MNALEWIALVFVCVLIGLGLGFINRKLDKKMGYGFGARFYHWAIQAFIISLFFIVIGNSNGLLVELFIEWAMILGVHGLVALPGW